MTTLDPYHLRTARARDHIDRHLDSDMLDLEQVSAVAAFSKFHFHRQFVALFGLSVHRYQQLGRMKRAAFRLAHKDDSILQIALEAGYETPDAFARAFRQRVGQSPSSFRQDPDWQAWREAFTPLDQARTTLMNRHFSLSEVVLTEFPATRVAIMTHRGSPDRLGETIQRFIMWRQEHDLSPRKSATFTLFHDDPQTTPPDLFRLGLCAGTDKSLKMLTRSDETIEIGEIPAGRCAMLRVVGTVDTLEDAALFLYREWLPASGEEIRDFPLFCQRIAFYPHVPEHEAIADLYLPLK